MSDQDAPQPALATPVRRRRWIIAAAITAVLAITASALIIGYLRAGDRTAPAASAPSVPASATPTALPAPTPTSSPAPAPVTDGINYAAASFTDFTAFGEADSGTQVSADRDGPHNGGTSLRIDSTTAAGLEHRGITRAIAVGPSTSYEFSAWVYSPAAHPDTEPVLFTVGRAPPAPFIEGTGGWARVTSSYTTGADEHSLAFSIAPSGPVSGFRLDDLGLTVSGAQLPAGDTGLVSNGTFESFGSPNLIRNPTLVFDTGSAGIDVGWFTPSVDYSVTDRAGTVVSAGSLALPGGLGRIDLTALPQGIYGVELAAPDGAASTIGAASRIATDFIILDPATGGSDVHNKRFGVGAHVERRYYDGSERAAAALGITAIRNDAFWDEVELSPGNYDFDTVYSTPFRAFEAAGIEPLVISNGPNPLYDRGQTPSSGGALAAYARYSQALVQQYTLPAVEIFNELNSTRFNNSACGAGADCYLPILRAAYTAVKATHPDTLIVGPANANQDDPYLTELYRIGGLDYLDVVSYHPYTATPEGFVSDIQQAQARLREYNNGQPKRLWLTEFGWTSPGAADSELTLAKYLIRSETIALANGVERLYWYDLVNDELDVNDHEGNFGLFRRATATVPAFEPKPSALAQGMLIRKIGGKAYSATDVATTSYSYAFGDAADAVRVAWATVPAPIRYVTDTPLTVTSSDGGAAVVLNPIDGVVTVPLTDTPQFIEGAVSGLR